MVRGLDQLADRFRFRCHSVRKSRDRVRGLALEVDIAFDVSALFDYQTRRVDVADDLRARANVDCWLGLAPGTVGVYQLNFVVPPTAPFGNVTVQLQRSNCAVFFGAYCTSGGEFYPNASPGCISVDGNGNVCTSSAVPLPIQ